MGDFYNHKADVWSLGCIFYELLTGFSPFTGTDKQNLKNNLVKGEYSFPKTLKVSLNGLSFLNECLQYDADNRISFEELVKHPYILEDPRISLASTDPTLFMSYNENSGDFVNEHSKVIKNPY